MLYMFQAVPPPIISRSKLYTHHRVFVEVFLLFTGIVTKLTWTEPVSNPGLRGRKQATTRLRQLKV